ncbi:hypothetical protein [Cupriavidus nantongensis]
MGDKTESRTFKERTDEVMRVFGVILPAPVRQLLRDFAAEFDRLREQKQ